MSPVQKKPELSMTIFELSIKVRHLSFHNSKLSENSGFSVPGPLGAQLPEIIVLAYLKLAFPASYNFWKLRAPSQNSVYSPYSKRIHHTSNSVNPSTSPIFLNTNSKSISSSITFLFSISNQFSKIAFCHIRFVLYSYGTTGTVPTDESQNN